MPLRKARELAKITPASGRTAVRGARSRRRVDLTAGDQRAASLRSLGADIDALGIERGHRTLTILRKGRKIVTIPLAPRTARAIDLAIGERADGPIFLRPDRQRMDRHCAGRIVHRVVKRR
jgi:phosphopantothenate synthetase